MHWVTTWEHRANSAIAPLCGLARDLPVLTHGVNDEEWDLDWKFVAVRKAIEQDPRPFVWIDDGIDSSETRPLRRGNGPTASPCRPS